ncbi:MAG: DUF2520 domain-containing protein [Bacteroidia bacterium]|nr:DUF2520 domain-containing protein [Bacteroidia bacterium]
MNKVKNIVLFGAGNVAAHLSKALVGKGFTIVQLFNRTEETGNPLARLIGASYTGSLKKIEPDADLYILALSDSAVPEIASQLRIRSGIVVHTSGSLGMEVLRQTSNQTGVLYPLQTFRKGKLISFYRIPICVEANLPAVEKVLIGLAEQLSSNVHVINSEQRKILHLTAVFAGNFTNYLYAIAEDLLHQYNIPFELLKPLIKHTAANIRYSDLFSLQTGPAIREDTAIIEKHLKLLENQKSYQEIYNLISKQIIQYKHRNGKL